MLPEQTVKRIEDEAKNKYPDISEFYFYLGFIEGATSEATRSQVLLEALESLVNLKDHKDLNGKTEHYEFAQPLAWEKARNAISSYNNQTNR